MQERVSSGEGGVECFGHGVGDGAEHRCRPSDDEPAELGQRSGVVDDVQDPAVETEDGPDDPQPLVEVGQQVRTGGIRRGLGIDTIKSSTWGTSAEVIVRSPQLRRSRSRRRWAVSPS
ncbi:hypothetical protein GCM10023175_08900 [Pseudonocardia xishanensis]|uniref:Uncharacterized protein n=1 Tax=Pseudonocardia xishanensis TaxID=630995 RepID=A0ABP8RHM7_9PSEU